MEMKTYRKVHFSPVLSVSANGSTSQLNQKVKKITPGDPFFLNQSTNPLTPFHWANIS